jgi:hypothetical protein
MRCTLKNDDIFNEKPLHPNPTLTALPLIASSLATSIVYAMIWEPWKT